MTAPLIIQTQNQTLVQIASSWPRDDAGWSMTDVWCQKASRGANNDVGSATLFTPSSTLFKPGATTSTVVKSMAYCGKYCRISKQDIYGTISDDGGRTYSPFWHGVINSREISNNGMMLDNTYNAAGLISILDSVVPQYHFCETASLTIAADIGAPLVFNYLGAKKTGNRSSVKYDFGRGVTAYVFSRNGDATFWTAQDVVEYYLALFAYFATAGPIFSLAGQLTALSWLEKWDLNGHSCGEAVSRVMSQKQGIGYKCIRLSATGRQPIIDVSSLSKIAVTVPATPFTPSFTLPASDEQIEIDLTVPTRIQQFNIIEDATGTTDEQSVAMAKPWYGVTLSLFDDFSADWTDEDQTAYDELDPLETYGTLNTNFGIARVYRRFQLKDDWAGNVVGGFVLPNKRSVSSSTLLGASGLNGAATSDAGSMRPLGKLFVMTSDLPCLDGYDWSTVDPATVDKTRRNASAMAFMENGDGTWSTLAENATGAMSTISIEIDADLGAITFPAEVAETIRAAHLEGLKIYVTVGMYGQLDDIVSWRRATDALPRDQRRLSGKARPALMRKILPVGTVVGVSPDGNLMVTSSEVIIHDDTALAQSVLAISSPWSMHNHWGVTYHRTGEIDTDSVAPCMLTTGVKWLEADGTVTTEDATGVVTGITFDFTGDGKTSITTRRIPIDVEPVL